MAQLSRFCVASVECRKNVCHQELFRKRGGQGTLMKGLLGVLLLTLPGNVAELPGQTCGQLCV